MLKREFLSAQFLHFLLAGSLAALGNFLSRPIYQHGFNLSYEAAIVLAYLTGMLIAFLLYRQRVFARSRQSLLHEILLFSAVNLLAILQTLLVSLGTRDYLLPLLGWQSDTLAHAVGIIVPVFTSFLGHKYLTFGRQPENRPLP